MLSSTDYLVLAFEAKDGLTMEKLNILYRAIKSIEALPHVHESINPFNVITLEKQGLKLKFTTLAQNAEPPKTEEEFNTFIERLKTDGNITDSEIKELSKDLQVVPLSIPYSVVIKDIDYLTNDGNGEYVILYNPSSSSANIPGWYIMDSFAYNNNECWNYDGTPKDSCEYYGREHIIRVYGRSSDDSPFKNAQEP